MADRKRWPDSWPGPVFFVIGAALGFGFALLGCLLVPLRFGVALPVSLGFGILFGFLGMAFREDIFFLLPPWS
jgi:hypothetical protein